MSVGIASLTAKELPTAKLLIFILLVQTTIGLSGVIEVEEIFKLRGMSAGFCKSIFTTVLPMAAPMFVTLQVTLIFVPCPERLLQRLFLQE